MPFIERVLYRRSTAAAVISATHCCALNKRVSCKKKNTCRELVDGIFTAVNLTCFSAIDYALFWGVVVNNAGEADHVRLFKGLLIRPRPRRWFIYQTRSCFLFRSLRVSIYMKTPYVYRFLLLWSGDTFGRVNNIRGSLGSGFSVAGAREALRSYLHRFLWYLRERAKQPEQGWKRVLSAIQQQHIHRKFWFKWEKRKKMSFFSRRGCGMNRDICPAPKKRLINPLFPLIY